MESWVLGTGAQWRELPKVSAVLDLPPPLPAVGARGQTGAYLARVGGGVAGPRAHQIVDEWLVPFNARHCNLILNVAPNRDGRFDPNAVERLAEIGELWRNRVPAPRLTASQQILTPASPSGDLRMPAALLIRTGRTSRMTIIRKPTGKWDDGQTSGWIEIDLQTPTHFNTVTVVEPTYLGNSRPDSRIASYRVEARIAGQWHEVLIGDSPTAMVYRVKPTCAERVRLTFRESSKSPGIAELGLYAEPD